MFLIPPPPFSYESRCFPRFSTRRIIIQENTSLPPLSIFTRQEQLLSIICFQTGDFLDPPPSLHSPPHIASCHLFSSWYGEKKNKSWPFLFHLHLFDTCATFRKHPRIAARQTGPVRHYTWPPTPFLFIILCVLYIFLLSTVLTYCRHLDRWGTLVLRRRAPRLDSASVIKHTICVVSSQALRMFTSSLCGRRCSYVWRSRRRICCFRRMHNSA